ncbi:MAG: DUF4886 domain-containing protein [Bacteroidaceae bacterium]|nr:DUF4886 domain-containing protein [Bacteroidaceae bacterium]
MKFLLGILCLNFLVTGAYATSLSDSTNVSFADIPFHNLTKDSLKILDIGNSYTTDATHYIPQITNAAGAIGGYSLYSAVRSSASYKSWVNIYNDCDFMEYRVNKVAGDEIEGVNAGVGEIGDGVLFRQALERGNWDLIIIHQVSLYANDFDLWGGDTAGGYLNELLTILCETNPQASIGIYLIHSYRGDYKNNTEGSSLARWQNVADAIKKLKLNYGIDFVIPYGTAAQNLRASSLNDEYDFSYDGAHLSDGIGDYVAACCYWEALLAPRFGSIIGNSWRYTNLNENTAGVKKITDETVSFAQKAAVLAMRNMYQLTDVDSFDTYMQLPAEYVCYDNRIIGYNYNKPMGCITIPDSIVGITRGVFNDCKEVRRLILPAGLRSLGNYAFNNCTAIEAITSFIPGDELFPINESVFNGVDKSACTLYVPYGSKEAYTSTDGWKDFYNVVEGDLSDISEIKSDDWNVDTEIVYDMNGRRTKGSTNGIHIINGKKVLVKQ